jgi:hypothetical protein
MGADGLDPHDGGEVGFDQALSRAVSDRVGGYGSETGEFTFPSAARIML